jgi:hypothetical protein
MTYDYRSMVEDAETLSKRKLHGMPREDILAYECGLLRGVVQTLCRILNTHELTIEAQNAVIETYKRIIHDNTNSTRH